MVGFMSARQRGGGPQAAVTNAPSPKNHHETFEGWRVFHSTVKNIIRYKNTAVSQQKRKNQAGDKIKVLVLRNRSSVSHIRSGRQIVLLSRV